MEAVKEKWTDERLDDLNGKVDEMGRRVDLRFDAMERRFDSIDRRFEAFERRFEAMDSRLDAIQRTMVLGFASMAGAMVTCFVALATLIFTQG